MKCIVTGASGMLADALCPLLRLNGYSVYPTDITTDSDIIRMDIRDLDEVSSLVKRYKPDIIFHLAAKTDVDKCELEPENAYEVNFKATENIARVCKEQGIVLVYISTASVFDGEKREGYTEFDKTNPINVYGRSKLMGEEAVKSLVNNYYIVRGAWMIGGHDKDKKFVWKIVQLLKTEKEISAVTDLKGSPTFTRDFSLGLIKIVSTGNHGIYHCVNEGICTRFEMAKKIAEYLKKEDIVIKGVSSDMFKMPAPRGKCEALINYKLNTSGLYQMRNWEDALREYLTNT